MNDHELRTERLHRLAALIHARLAGEHRIAAAAVRAGASIRQLTDAIRASEAREVATHPDLAELDLQMNGFYDGP